MPRRGRSWLDQRRRGRAAAGTAAVAPDLLAALLCGRLGGHLVPAPDSASRAPVGVVRVRIRRDGDGLVVDGRGAPGRVGDQAQTCCSSPQARRRGSHPGAGAGHGSRRHGSPLGTVDLTRRFGTVRFDGVRLPAERSWASPGRPLADVDHQLLVAIALLCAESVGAMQAGVRHDRDLGLRPLHRSAARSPRTRRSSTGSPTCCRGSRPARRLRRRPERRGLGCTEAAELVSAAKSYIGALRRRAHPRLRAASWWHGHHLRARRAPVPAPPHREPGSPRHPGRPPPARRRPRRPWSEEAA